MVSILPYGKKMFSLALTFNALLSIFYAIGLLTGYYTGNWTMFAPYVIDGALFWAIIPISIINIFPAVKVGKVRTGRLWFHHYVYGFIVLALSCVSIVLFAPISPTSLLTANITTANVNIGRFFILGGLTLVLDDLPDVSKKLESALKRMKTKAGEKRRTIHKIQILTGLVALYFFLSISIYLTQKPAEATLANFILIAAMLVTSLTSFASAKRKIWLNITTESGLDR